MNHLFRLLLCLFLLFSAACSHPADPVMTEYESALVRADSLAGLGTTDSTQAARLISDLHRQYDRAKEETAGKRVRLAPVAGRVPWVRLTLIVALLILIVKLTMLEERIRREEMQRICAVRLSECEEYLRDNEREKADLEEYLDRLDLTDETRDEVKLSLAVLIARNEQLRGQIDDLRTRLDESRKQASSPDVTLINERDRRIRLLDEQVRLLSTQLLDRDELLSSLRLHPRFLTETDWRTLSLLADRAYNRLPDRLAGTFPQLTPSDIQLCLLMRFRFTNAQIATLVAVSPSSVSQQKFRLKKRLLQADSTLLREGETLDAFVWRF